MVHEMHPEVAAALKDAQSLIQIMDDQLYKMRSTTFTGCDEYKSVEVTLNGHHQLLSVVISDGLLRLGAETVEQRLNEAVRNANNAATESIMVDQERLEDLIAEAVNDWQ